MRKLLLNAAAIASIALPAMALAQDNQDRGAPDRAAAAAADARHQDQRQDQRQDQHQVYRQDQRPDVRPDQHSDNRQVMRQDGRVDWNHQHMWNRADRSWWRGRPEFNGYVGVRSGYWFVPGRGYIRPDPRWYGYNWQVGGVVPRLFWDFTVINPYIYGLPPAPPAYRYVYLGNNIALISRYSGRIVRIIPNVY